MIAITVTALSENSAELSSSIVRGLTRSGEYAPRNRKELSAMVFYRHCYMNRVFKSLVYSLWTKAIDCHILGPALSS